MIWYNMVINDMVINYMVLSVNLLKIVNKDNLVLSGYVIIKVIIPLYPS